MNVYIQRIWDFGRLLPTGERRLACPGSFEVETANGIRVARLLGRPRATGDPNLLPPLYEPQLVRASGTMMRLRGWEKLQPTAITFQEWLIDFHPDGYGKFADG